MFLFASPNGFCLVLMSLLVGRSGGSYCTGGPLPSAKPNLYAITAPGIAHTATYFPDAAGDGGGVSATGVLYTATHAAGNATFPVLHLVRGSGDPLSPFPFPLSPFLSWRHRNQTRRSRVFVRVRAVRNAPRDGDGARQAAAGPNGPDVGRLL